MRYGLAALALAAVVVVSLIAGFFGGYWASALLAKGGRNYPATAPVWLGARLDDIATVIRPRTQNRMVKQGRLSVEMVYFPRSVLKPRFGPPG